MKFYFPFLILMVLVFSCQKNQTFTSVSTVTENKNLDTSNVVTPPLTAETFKPNPKQYYQDAYVTISNMLASNDPLIFKKAVFITENAYVENQNDYLAFNNQINKIVDATKTIILTKKLNYPFPDSVKVQKNASIFFYFADTTFYLENGKLKFHYPIQYDFEDYNGKENWSQMFVMKLLSTNTGNCHSLPFLYKIIADELGTDAYLSLAPNHIYLKHKSKMTGWYNTELTSKEFPLDAWIMASGFITLDAIRSGIYMDTLSNKQSVALCLIDLAKGYERKFGNNDDSYILQCTETALQYFPNYINAMLLKAEILKKRFDRMMKENNAKHPSEIFHIKEANDTYLSMQQLYVKVLELGYREIPEKMYMEWLTSLKEEKYKNKKVVHNK